MIKLKIMRVFFSFLVIAGSFLSIATAKVGDAVFYVNIGHLKGLSFLIPVLGIVLTGLVVLSVYKNIAYEKIWIASICILGLILSLYITATGKTYVKAFAEQIIAFEREKIDFMERFHKTWDGLKDTFNDMKKKEDIKGKEVDNERKVLEGIKVDTGIGMGSILWLMGFGGVLGISFLIRNSEKI